MEKMTKEQLANMFDHTLLKPFATKEDFQRLCEDSKKYGFKMVAVNSAPVALCKEYLKGSGVHVGAAVSFPLGQTTIECKVFETKDAIANGADEIDYVIPGNDDAIRAVKLIAGAMADAVLEGKQGNQEAPAEEANA